MDEVVVTGYQKIERRKLTSSITTVDMETLKTVNQPNIDKLLQGQVPGMTIMSTSGAPGCCASDPNPGYVDYQRECTAFVGGRRCDSG